MPVAEKQAFTSCHFKVGKYICSVQENKHKPWNGQKFLRHVYE